MMVTFPEIEMPIVKGGKKRKKESEKEKAQEKPKEQERNRIARQKTFR